MIHRTRITAPLGCLVLAGLAGCATDTAFPSLAPRPIEAIARQPERVATDGPRVADPALDTQVATIARALDENAATWGTALAAARVAVERARGHAVGDESWVSAQQAISRLEPTRQAAGALVDQLDALRLRQTERTTPPDTARLDSAWTRGVAQVEAQSRAYQAVATALPTG